jgi:ferredoxin-thioredoxin reductase catalytic subunit
MHLNPDKEIVAEVREGIKKKGGYCPCKVEKIKDNICPCKDLREKKECICGLYVE